MSFRGSRHLRAERGTVLLERAGARKADAMTTEDYTSYYALVPARALPLALWVESERMAFTLECFDDRILDLERSLIEEEEAVTGVNTWFPRTAVRRFFGAKHPYYVHSGELVGDLDAVRLTDAQWFYQRAYRPDNARLILVGDFDPARADEWVRRYFGSIVNPSELFSRPTPPKVAAASVSRLAVEASVNRDALRVLWPAPPPGTREQLAMILFARELVHRLRRQLIDQKQTAIEIHVESSTYDAGSLIALNVVLTHAGRIEVVESDIDHAIAALRGADWSRLLPGLVREDMTDTLIVAQDPIKRASRHIEMLRSNGKPFDVFQYLALTRSITPADVRRIAPYLSPTRRLVASVASPRGWDPTWPASRTRVLVQDHAGNWYEQ